ncbi:MAG: dockerin type I repeat-containing protein [Gammaproteobacteria bacterium]|nr:dockerin type I repeat-containing protein [Gammaproteobacteria bacterium]
MWRFIYEVLRLLLLVTAALPALADNSHNKASLPAQASPGIHGLEQAWVRPDGVLVARERISGNGHISAPHVIVEGILAPGNSPGCTTFGGNVTFSFSATMSMEIAGFTPCTEHDQISVANQLTINSATLKVSLISGFVPAFGDSFDIMDWGSLTGTFGTINTNAATLPYPLEWDSSQLYLSGELIVGVQQIADGDLAPWNNPDGMINAADLMIAIQLVLNQRTAGPLQLAHGDMNGDGVIDLVDLLHIQQIVLP